MRKLIMENQEPHGGLRRTLCTSTGINGSVSGSNNKKAAAEKLGMHKATLLRKIKKYNITKYDVIR